MVILLRVLQEEWARPVPAAGARIQTIVPQT